MNIVGVINGECPGPGLSYYHLFFLSLASQKVSC